MQLNSLNLVRRVFNGGPQTLIQNFAYRLFLSFFFTKHRGFVIYIFLSFTIFSKFIVFREQSFVSRYILIFRRRFREFISKIFEENPGKAPMIQKRPTLSREA